jgi:hypothetical protein
VITPRGALRSALLLLIAAPAALNAQSLRFRSVTTARYVQLRPLLYDSVGNTFVAGDRDYAAPFTEDLEVNAWGLGVQGLRFYGLFRFRGSMGGSELVWPRYDDHFDALWGFAELERTKYRLRLGRLQRRSELGLYAFDGAMATLRPRPNLRFEAYGGRGLARGFLEPYNSSAISSIDQVVPNTGSLLMGASAWVSAAPGTWFSALLQREITSDRSGLISQRAALNGEVAAGRHLVFAGYADADLAMGTWGKARLSAMVLLPHSSRVEVAAFRYRPILPLNTIWGVFSPEGYSGGSVTADYAPTHRLTLTASYSGRHYAAATETTPFMPNLEDWSHTITAGARWIQGDFHYSADYHHLTGYGGGQSGFDAEVAFDRGGQIHLGVFGTGFQQQEEFRVAYGSVLGAGFNGRAQVNQALNLRAQLVQYWQQKATGMAAPDWNQLRALLGVEIVFGANADRLPGGVQ